MSPELLERENHWETIPSGELDGNVRERLYSFRESLDRAKLEGFFALPENLFEAEAENGKPLNTQVHNKIADILNHNGDGLYLAKDYEWLSEEDSYSFDVLRTAKAETSAHGVFFGVLVDPLSGRELPIAVKPCEEKPEKAYIDWANNSMIGKTGRKNFKPVGFLSKGAKTFSITELETNIETLDNSNWNNVLLDPSDDIYVQQRELLGKVGAALADLHKDNIIHGDTQFKNIAVDIAGQVFFIDWERSSMLNKAASEEWKMRKMTHDLIVMVRSVACTQEEMGVSLLSNFSHSLKWEYFKKYIFDPYLEAFQIDNDPKLFDRLADIEDGVKEYVLSPTGLASTIKSISAGNRQH
jgi:hypothetical protein